MILTVLSDVGNTVISNLFDLLMSDLGLVFGATLLVYVLFYNYEKVLAIINNDYFSKNSYMRELRVEEFKRDHNFKSTVDDRELDYIKFKMSYDKDKNKSEEDMRELYKVSKFFDKYRQEDEDKEQDIRNRHSRLRNGFYSDIVEVRQ